jgi:hypothetical protein
MERELVGEIEALQLCLLQILQFGIRVLLSK